MQEKTADHELEAAGLRLVAKHILGVQMRMHDCINNLMARMVVHDQSKYSAEELGLVLSKPALDKHPYMSKEERDELTGIQGALAHHYAYNLHHPEHHENGIDDMTLFDLIEMACDWKAASEMSPNGSFENSIEFGKTRFEMSSQLVRIFKNTADELGW